LVSLTYNCNSVAPVFYILILPQTISRFIITNSINREMECLRSRKLIIILQRIRLDFYGFTPGPECTNSHRKKDRWNCFVTNRVLPGSLPSDTINYLFEDSKKRLWIGTRNGLAVYQPETDNFRIFRHNSANSASISHNNITAILEDADGKIWVGTENGLNQWQESTGTFKRFFFSPKESNYCLELFSDKQQRLWLS
jgi:hypothetical protein